MQKSILKKIGSADGRADRCTPPTVGPGGFLGLEQSYEAYVVLGHDPIQHVVRTFRIGHRQLVEFEQMFLDQ